MIAVAKTARRVESNTAEHLNRKIQRQIKSNVASYGATPESIDVRLAELDEEWDVERCLETMAPILTLAGVCLGLTKSKKWFALPIAVQAFFLQHAIQGWCPPLIFLRRMGIRTFGEIERERTALRAMRGDFKKNSRAKKSRSAPSRG